MNFSGGIGSAARASAKVMDMNVLSAVLTAEGADDFVVTLVISPGFSRCCCPASVMMDAFPTCPSGSGTSITVCFGAQPTTTANTTTVDTTATYLRVFIGLFPDLYKELCPADGNGSFGDFQLYGIGRKLTNEAGEVYKGTFDHPCKKSEFASFRIEGVIFYKKLAVRPE